jgi:type II secretory pathway component GspD/PulD (secretin)
MVNIIRGSFDMRKILSGCLLSLAQLAFAADYAFDNVPLPSFAAAVIKNGFNREVMIHPTVLAKTISLNVTVPDGQAFSTIENALLLHGVMLRDDGTIIYLLPASGANPHVLFSDSAPELRLNPPSSPVTPYWGNIKNSEKADFFDETKPGIPKEDLNIVVYRPRYKDVSYLAEIVEFSGGRVLPSKTGYSSMLVYGVADDEQAEKVQKSLELVDVAENSIRLHVAFIEVTGADTSGFTLSGLIKMLSGRFSLNFGASRAAGVGLSIKNTSIDSVLSVLDEQVTFKYLAEPSLAVVHGKEARLVVGSDVPLRGSVSRDSAGVTLQSVSYKTTGLQMVVKPSIYEDSVMIDGSFEVSSIAANSSSEIDSPLILRRSLSTVFPLANGEVVILGGLDDERASNTRSGFFGLPFGSRHETNTSRILILAELRRGTAPTCGEQEEQPRRPAHDLRERGQGWPP